MAVLSFQHCGIGGLAIGPDPAAIRCELWLRRETGPGAFGADQHRHIVNFQSDGHLDGGVASQAALDDWPPRNQPQSRPRALAPGGGPAAPELGLTWPSRRSHRAPQLRKHVL